MKGSISMEENNTKITLWQDKKRPIFGLPLSFTKYTLTNEKLVIDSGVLARKQEEVRLYRIVDFSVKQQFWNSYIESGVVEAWTFSNYTIASFWLTSFLILKTGLCALL